jgi:hypothetical protein
VAPIWQKPTPARKGSFWQRTLGKKKPGRPARAQNAYAYKVYPAKISRPWRKPW